VGQPEAHSAADRRLVALDQLGRRVLVAGPHPPDQLIESGSINRLLTLPVC
jgi:hypothetical protein